MLLAITWCFIKGSACWWLFQCEDDHGLADWYFGNGLGCFVVVLDDYGCCTGTLNPLDLGLAGTHQHGGQVCSEQTAAGQQLWGNPSRCKSCRVTVVHVMSWCPWYTWYIRFNEILMTKQAEYCHTLKSVCFAGTCKFVQLVTIFFPELHFAPKGSDALGRDQRPAKLMLDSHTHTHIYIYLYTNGMQWLCTMDSPAPSQQHPSDAGGSW